jgi:hypothetical protein
VYERQAMWTLRHLGNRVHTQSRPPLHQALLIPCIERKHARRLNAWGTPWLHRKLA